MTAINYQGNQKACNQYLGREKDARINRLRAELKETKASRKRFRRMYRAACDELKAVRHQKRLEEQENYDYEQKQCEVADALGIVLPADRQKAIVDAIKKLQESVNAP